MPHPPTRVGLGSKLPSASKPPSSTQREQQLAAFQRFDAEVKDRKRQLKDQKIQLEEAMRRAEAEHEDKLNEMKEKRAQKRAMIYQYKQQIESLEIEVRELTQKRDDLKVQIDAGVGEFTKLTEMREANKAEIEKVRADWAEMNSKKDDIAKSRMEIERLWEETKRKEREVGKLAHDIIAMRQVLWRNKEMLEEGKDCGPIDDRSFALGVIMIMLERYSYYNPDHERVRGIFLKQARNNPERLNQMLTSGPSYFQARVLMWTKAVEYRDRFGHTYKSPQIALSSYVSMERNRRGSAWATGEHRLKLYQEKATMPEPEAVEGVVDVDMEEMEDV